MKRSSNDKGSIDSSSQKGGAGAGNQRFKKNINGGGKIDNSAFLSNEASKQLPMISPYKHIDEPPIIKR